MCPLVLPLDSNPGVDAVNYDGIALLNCAGLKLAQAGGIDCSRRFFCTFPHIQPRTVLPPCAPASKYHLAALTVKGHRGENTEYD